MKRCLIMLVASLMLALVAGVGTATAGLTSPSPLDQQVSQSQAAENEIEQTATANSGAVNLSPNTAVGNEGGVSQNSGASSEADASNANASTQSNTLTNGAGQSQGAGETSKSSNKDCCPGTNGKQSQPAQSITQGQSAENSIDQDARANSAAVNASPNTAIGNGTPTKKLSPTCGGCSEGNGGVKQNSGASSEAEASNWNVASQSNTLTNGAGQSQTGADQGERGCGCPEKKGGPQGNPSQSISQTQDAENEIEQKATANSLAVNASPNIAVLNFGSVDQRSGASSEADASNWNASRQSNTLTNGAGQSQTGSAEGTGHSCGCSERSRSHSPSQEITQDQSAENSIEQEARANSFALNASPNVALLNFGSVQQSSGASSEAEASNWNLASQSNTLTQGAGQGQTLGGCGCSEHTGRSCGCSDGKKGHPSQSIDQRQSGENEIEQAAHANSIAINASPNVALLNFGSVQQRSGASSKAKAKNHNLSTQGNTLSQGAGQQISRS